GGPRDHRESQRLTLGDLPVSGEIAGSRTTRRRRLTAQPKSEDRVLLEGELMPAPSWVPPATTSRVRAAFASRVMRGSFSVSLRSSSCSSSISKRSGTGFSAQLLAFPVSLAGVVGGVWTHRRQFDHAAVGPATLRTE